MSFPKQFYFCYNSIDSKVIRRLNIWKKINPDYEINYYDDTMCCDFLIQHFGELYEQLFLFLEDGAIKADFWRICILYIYGGIYSDIDNEPLVKLKIFIEQDIDFITCSSYSPVQKFNPNFIGCNKGNQILKKCIDWYVNKYTDPNRRPYIRDGSSYWEWSVMTCFTDVLVLENYHKEEGVYTSIGYGIDNTTYKVQILKEIQGKNFHDDHNIYKNMRVFNNRYKDWNIFTHSFR